MKKLPILLLITIFFSIINLFAQDTISSPPSDKTIIIESTLKTKSLRGKCANIQDQGEQPACAAYALSYYLEMEKDTSISGKHLYGLFRKEGYRKFEDEGTKMSKALAFCKKEGLIDQFDDLFYKQAPQETKIQAVKELLDKKKPAIVVLPYTLELDEYRGNGIISNKQDTTDSIGYREAGQPSKHAVVIIGYNDAERAFEFINSWGEKWGRKGYGWITYDAFAQLCNKAFRVRNNNFEAQIQLDSKLSYDRISRMFKMKLDKDINRFALDASTIHTNFATHVYIFSINNTGKVIHLENATYNPAFENQNINFYSTITEQMKGKDYICLLYAQKKMTEIRYSTILEDIQEENRALAGNKLFSKNILAYALEQANLKLVNDQDVYKKIFDNEKYNKNRISIKTALDTDELLSVLIELSYE